MKKLLRTLVWLALCVVLVASLPFWIWLGFGLWRGHDVVSGMRAYVSTSTGTTIAASLVPLHRPVVIEWLGNLQDLDLSEASGLAASRRRDDLLWLHNDSGNPHDLYATDTTGQQLGRVRLDDSFGGDWEDMASFVLDDQAYLLVADVGDNYRWRRTLELHVVEEPEVPAEGVASDARATVAWSLRFRYPDGKRDCEAVAVDTSREEILLLSKRTVPAEVYRLPLRPADPAETLVAERIGTLSTLPQPDARALEEDPDYGSSRSQPTAFDVRGDVAAVITYGDAYLYTRQPQESWGTALERIPERVVLPPASQREAGAFSRDGQALYVSSERNSRGAASIFRVRLAAAPER